MYCSFLYFCIRKQKKISLLHSDRIRAKYKDVVIQCCASGGGRANWGTSYFFPAIAMASHISAVPNHTVYRDMKEAPKAMQCYQDAVECVDTSLLLL